MIDNFDPSRIRRYYLQDLDNDQMVQFTAIGDRHSMIKQDDGSMVIEKLVEKGKEYKYGPPLSLNQALDILMKNTHPSHLAMAGDLQKQTS